MTCEYLVLSICDYLVLSIRQRCAGRGGEGGERGHENGEQK